MQVFSSGTGRTRTTGREKKAGWWALGPFIYGLFFVLLGIGFLVGGAAVPAAASGLYVTGVAFVVTGGIALFVAWYIRRDIKSGDDAAPLRGAVSDQTELTLRATGVPGSATVKAFKFLGDSAEGTTLVELRLDVTTTRGGTVAVTKQLRVPIGASGRLAAGATVPVTVSSSDPNQLLCDWNGLVTT